MIERIMHAAIHAESGMVFIGKRHADAFNKCINVGLVPSSKADHQGFITSRGRFVDRREAAKIALESGQCKRVPGGVLISECLWSAEDGGEFAYCEIKGYHKEAA